MPSYLVLWITRARPEQAGLSLRSGPGAGTGGSPNRHFHFASIRCHIAEAIPPVTDEPPMTPWTDRSGRLSPHKAATFAALFLPALWIGYEFFSGGYAPRPFTAANHTAGDWTIRLLIMTLAVTPLRRITGWNRLITIRRMLGVATALYALLHVTLYVGDLGWNVPRALSEIVSRFYLGIGLVTLLGLSVLALTSTDAAVRRLRRNWGRLHRLVHPIAWFGLFHFFLQSRFDVFEPTLLAGLYLALACLRLSERWGLGSAAAGILVSAVAATALTFGLLIAWYHFNNAIPPARVVTAVFSLGRGLSPVWWVLIVALLPLIVTRQTVQSLRPLFMSAKSG